jgi:hypothetical protein
MLGVGATHALATALLIKNARSANHWAFVAGGGLAIWILTEVAMLGETSWLQIVYLIVGIGIQALALSRHVELGEPA